MCWISISRTSASVERRVDRLLRVREELGRRRAEAGVARVLGRSIIVAQRFQHRRQVGLELLDRLAELGDLRPLVAEEQLEQLLQRLRRRSSPQRITSCRFWISTACAQSSKMMLSCG